LRARVLLVVLFVYLAVALCPAAPDEHGPGYDRSFIVGLNVAHAQGVAFGSELVYPYGPLGWLCRPMTLSGALGLAVGIQLSAYALFLALLALLVRRVRLSGAPGAALWTLVVVGASALLDPMALWLTHLELAVPVLAVLVFASPPERRLPALLALAALSAALLLVKLDAGIYAGVLCAVLGIESAWRRRVERGAAGRLLWMPPLVFALALATLFVLAPGRLSALPDFLRNSVSVLVHYKEMSFDGPPGRLVPMLAAGVMVFVLLPLVVRDRRRLLPALLLLLPPVLMLWQRVAMRQDEGHQVSFLPRLAALLLVPALALPPGRDRRIVGALQVLVLVAAGAFTVVEFPIYHDDLVARLSGRTAADAAAALSGWEETKIRLEDTGKGLDAPLRLGPKARAIVGDATIDAVPWQIERVVAHRWRWRPRPALQSSNAYSPRLDRLDSRRFSADDATDFVLADLDTIDGRHVFLEAPLTWRALLDHYDLREAYLGVLLLQRRATPRLEAPRLLGVQAVHWDQELAVPASDELVLLACPIECTLGGVAVGLLYHNAAVWLVARDDAGRERSWRVVRPNLASGAVVSALPVELAELRELFAWGPGEVPRVTSLRLHTDSPWQYAPELEARWLALPVREEERPWGAAVTWNDVEPFVLGEDCDSEGRPVLHLEGEPRLGRELRIEVRGAPPNGVVHLLIGASPAELTHESMTLYLDPSRMLLLKLPADEAGLARLSFNVPVEQWLVGLEVILQAALVQPDARPRWRASCGLRLVIGR